MIFTSYTIYLQSIRDTNVVTGYNLTVPLGSKSATLFIRNSLDQAVAIQLVLSADYALNVGSSFNVAASDGAVRVLSLDTSGIFVGRTLRATAQCSVAPTSGTLDAYFEFDVEDSVK